MFNAHDVDEKPIYVGDIVNVLDEDGVWLLTPGTDMRLEAEVECIPEAAMVQINPLNIGDMLLVPSEQVKIYYSFIHEVLEVDEQSLQAIIDRAETRYKDAISKKSRTKKTAKKVVKQKVVYL
jgi:hypothetical protein